MEDTFYFEIEGRPMPCPRPRATRQGRVYLPTEYTKRKKEIAIKIQEAMGERVRFKGPLSVSIFFLHPRIKSLQTKKAPSERQFKSTRPDLDNLAKTILDACTEAELWFDDSQVAQLVIVDMYAAKGEEAHTEVTLEALC